MSPALAVLSPVSRPSTVPGRVEPRLYTPPLRDLSQPDATYGHAVIAFARDVLGEPLDPWQAWTVVHAGELLPDGRPRFRQVLVLVARQNGKTTLLKILALYWLFVEQWAEILGQSTTLEMAREAWKKACDIAERSEVLAPLVAKVLRGNNDPHLLTRAGCTYRIASATRRGARGKSLDRLIVDELREHHTFEAIDAALFAMNARPFGQMFGLSNMGDAKSVVLDALRDAALAYIDTGEGDPRLGIFEYSAPDGCDVEDVEAWAAANPNLGHRLDYDTLAGAAARAKRAGGLEESGFRTEALCMRVRALDAAVDPQAWQGCAIAGEPEMPKGRTAFCIDVSPDNLSATLAAAAMTPAGKVRTAAIASWDGPQALGAVRRELPQLLRRLRPQVLGWLPNGPAAALAADLATRKGRTSWPPQGITVDEIRSEVSAVCMGFASMVLNGEVEHYDEPRVTTHVTGAAKLWSGDTWRYSRKGEGHCDAAYAAAGAAHLARTLPAPVGKPRLIVV